MSSSGKIVTVSLFLLVMLFCIQLSFPAKSEASSLGFSSDLIVDSTPSATTTHTLTFTVASPVPASGQVVIIPEANAGGVFTVPVGMAPSDIEFAVSSGGPFTPRSLAAAQSPANDGVTFVTGANGTISITLASGSPGLLTGDQVRLVIGGPLTALVSPAVQSSYRMRIRTYNAASAPLDTGTAMIAIVNQVTVTSRIEVILPVRSNGLPSGLLPGATTNVLVSLNTDIPAFCKYATTSGVDFFSMSSTTIFLDANGLLLHYIEVAVSENNIFTYYLRCRNANGFPNTDDYLISFEIGVKPNASSTPPAPPPPPPPPPSPPGPSGGGGGGGPFLQTGSVNISGAGIPGGALVILKDGKIEKEDIISALGTFSEDFTNLQRGTYTWGAYVKDPDGKRSSTYNSTIYLIAKTNNIIAPVYLSPTIKAVKTTVDLGGDVELSGYGIALTPVLAIMNKQGDVLNSKIVTASSTANGNGSWKMKLSTAGLAKGTYEVKAQSLIGKRDQSTFSPVLYIGVGESPNPNFGNRSDLNKDGKVNLVDFSILLFNWKGSDTTADINQDGIVNLIDFSIMLANWTG